MMSCLGLQEVGGELFQLLFIGRVVQGRHLVVLYHHLGEKWSGKLIQFLQRGVRMGLAEQVDIEFVALNQYALCKGVLLGSIDGKLIVVLVKKMSGLSPGCKFGWSVKILLLTLRRSALLMPSVSRLPPVAEVPLGWLRICPLWVTVGVVVQHRRCIPGGSIKRNEGCSPASAHFGSVLFLPFDVPEYSQGYY